jgi:hypothetical protein
MKTVFVTALAVLLALAFVPSQAQTDLSKVLIGKWEGELEKPKGPGAHRPKAFRPSTEQPVDGRTLVIQEVREEGGKWVVTRAQYGITGKRLGRVDVTLDMMGNEVTLQFETGAGSQAKLKLTGENALVGTLAIPRGGITPMELKKVE